MCGVVLWKPLTGQISLRGLLAGDRRDGQPRLSDYVTCMATQRSQGIPCEVAFKPGCAMSFKSAGPRY